VRVRGLAKPIRAAVVLLSVALVAIVVVLVTRGSHDDTAPALAAAREPAAKRGPPVLTLGHRTVGPHLPPGFVGFTIRYPVLEQYFGSNPKSLDPAFLQLLRDVSPNQRRVLRIGGDSTDWTWWPVPHMRKPPGIRFTLTPRWMSIAHAVGSDLDAQMILGINLEADSRRLAAAEAGALIARVGRRAIDALEIGNEPELYGSFGWYRTASGQEITGRPHGYDEADFFHEFSSFSRSLPRAPVAGPSSGSLTWLNELNSFLRDDRRVGLATIHAYPLKHCGTTPVTTSELLSDRSSHGLAQELEPYVRTAYGHHLPLRVDEINAVSCGGQRGVSDAFSSALWALDTLFELAKIGVRGVNIQTVPNTINEVLGASFSKHTWHVRVHPEYYGLLMFAQAAPAGSSLLRLTGEPPVGVKVWATRAGNGLVHVVVINKHLKNTETVRLRIPGVKGAPTVQQLRAPGMQARRGVTIGGQTFGSSTTTGMLVGHATSQTLQPSGGTYVVRVPAASATMLTFSGQ
jgi:Glycosyl hydrolase family 79 C-terminal beta domain